MASSVLGSAILFSIYTSSWAPASGATCLEEQVQSCRKAAADQNILAFSAGGECKSNSYVHYTHECRVNTYLPSIDFCCCAHEQKVMCCRYHQDWDRFRCSEADDTIDTLQLSHVPIPLEILLPCVLGPIAILACCIFCCVKCCCHKYYDEEDKECLSQCCLCCKQSDCWKKDDESEKNGGPSQDEHVPLTYPSLLQQHSGPLNSQSSQDSSSHSKLFFHSSSKDSTSSKLSHLNMERRQPSAPPAPDEVFVHCGDPTAYVCYSGGRNNNPDGHYAPLPVTNRGYSLASTGSTGSATVHAVCPSCSSAMIPSAGQPGVPPGNLVPTTAIITNAVVAPVAPIVAPPTYEESQEHNSQTAATP